MSDPRSAMSARRPLSRVIINQTRRCERKREREKRSERTSSYERRNRVRAAESDKPPRAEMQTPCAVVEASAFMMKPCMRCRAMTQTVLLFEQVRAMILFKSVENAASEALRDARLLLRG